MLVSLNPFYSLVSIALPLCPVCQGVLLVIFLPILAQHYEVSFSRVICLRELNCHVVSEPVDP